MTRSSHCDKRHRQKCGEQLRNKWQKTAWGVWNEEKPSLLFSPLTLSTHLPFHSRWIIWQKTKMSLVSIVKYVLVYRQQNNLYSDTISQAYHAGRQATVFFFFNYKSISQRRSTSALDTGWETPVAWPSSEVSLCPSHCHRDEGGTQPVLLSFSPVNHLTTICLTWANILGAVGICVKGSPKSKQMICSNWDDPGGGGGNGVSWQKSLNSKVWVSRGVSYSKQRGKFG